MGGGLSRASSKNRILDLDRKVFQDYVVPVYGDELHDQRLAAEKTTSTTTTTSTTATTTSTTSTPPGNDFPPFLTIIGDDNNSSSNDGMKVNSCSSSVVKNRSTVAHNKTASFTTTTNTTATTRSRSTFTADRSSLTLSPNDHCPCDGDYGRRNARPLRNDQSPTWENEADVKISTVAVRSPPNTQNSIIIGSHLAGRQEFFGEKDRSGSGSRCSSGSGGFGSDGGVNGVVGRDIPVVPAGRCNEAASANARSGGGGGSGSRSSSGGGSGSVMSNSGAYSRFEQSSSPHGSSNGGKRNPNTTSCATTTTTYCPESGGTLRAFIIRRNFKRATMNGHNKPNNKNQGSWKFWRRLSFRSRHESKNKASGDKSGTNLLHKRDGDDVFESGVDVTSVTPARALPDVVEKAQALPVYNTNSVPPPKPPRLFLIKSPGDINRNSSFEPNGETDRDPSRAGAPEVTDPTYMNVSSTEVAKKSQTLASPTVSSKLSTESSYTGENNNIVIDKSHLSMLVEIEEEQTDRKSADKVGHGNSLNVSAISKTGYNMAASVSPVVSRSPKTSFAYHSSTTPRKPKIVTPELSLKRPGRSRRKSSEKGDVTRLKHIMNSIVELMCQRLDPYPLLDPLKRAGVLTNLNVQSFLGHHDRKSVCEGLADIIGSGQPDFLSAFCDILSMAGGNCTEILEVLQVMREMDAIIHDTPESNPDDKSVLAEEKNINFDIGYLASDYSLKPLVELERVRLIGDKRLSKTSSRNSAYSLLETEADCASRTAAGGGGGGGDGGSFYHGLVMMSISVTGHSLAGKRAEALADVIRHHNCISELHLGKTQIGGKDVEVITKALASNSTIHSLDLRLNDIGHAGSEAVAWLLQQTRFLRILNLSSSGLDNASFRVVVSAVSGNKTLVELDASFLDINDESCRCLRDMLRVNVCLQRLRLRSNNLTWSGCHVLCEGLARNRVLTALDLSRNQIGDAGTQALAKYLPESSVSELCVENCGIGTCGCESLAELVSHCKKLKHIDMSTNELKDAGVMKLAPALERTSTVTNVSMNMCSVTNDGFSKLLDVLEKNTSIVQLKLCYNNLGREHTNQAATSDNLRYRLRIVTSSKPKLKILLWGNAFDDSS